MENWEVNHNGWELDHSGGGNWHLIKEFEIKDGNGKIATILISELGASIPLHEDGKTFKSFGEFMDDFTYEFIDIVDWLSEDDGYIINANALKYFEPHQIEEIVNACKHLDDLYEEGF
jgi:hypothetical protein